MTADELQRKQPEVYAALVREAMAAGAERERARWRAILQCSRRPEVRPAAEHLASKTACTPEQAQRHLQHAQRTVIRVVQLSKL